MATKIACSAQVLEEFYSNLRTVGVSALTGMGMDEFLDGVKACGQDWHRFYKPELDKRQKVRTGLSRT